MDSTSRRRLALLLALGYLALGAAAPPAARAQRVLEPGTVGPQLPADAAFLGQCNCEEPFLRWARGIGLSHLPLENAMTLSVEAGGLNTSASIEGSLVMDFSISPSPSGNESELIGSYLSLEPYWSAGLKSEHLGSQAGQVIEIMVLDQTESRIIGYERLHTGQVNGKTEFKTIKGVPIPIAAGPNEYARESDWHTVIPLPLKRGHQYRVLMRASARVIGSATLSDEARTVSGVKAGWRQMDVVVGADLFEAFNGHTHTYLTGYGVGHNIVQAETLPPAPVGTPAIPGSDGDADGVDDLADVCPATLPGVQVDRTGCAQDQFCARVRTNGKACAAADFLDDEGSRPGDCRMHGNRCGPAS